MFRFLTKRKDPTQSWTRKGSPSLDIGTWTIMGAEIWDRLDNIQDLGVCENVEDGFCLKYLRDGVQVLHEDGVIDDITVFMERDSKDGFEAYSGEVRILGEPIDPASIRKLGGVTDLLGEPKEIVSDKPNVFLIYEREGGKRRALFGYNEKESLFLIIFDR